jgi:hypothetical protein
MEQELSRCGGNVRYHVPEMYSPPRVNKLAEKMRLIPGRSLDLTVKDPDDGKTWVFKTAEKNDKATRIISHKRTLLAIGSPMCSAFSQLQGLKFSR